MRFLRKIFAAYIEAVGATGPMNIGGFY